MDDHEMMSRADLERHLEVAMQEKHAAECQVIELEGKTSSRIEHMKKCLTKQLRDGRTKQTSEIASILEAPYLAIHGDLERQLEVAGRDKESAVRQAVENAELKFKAVQSIRDIALARIEIVKKAVVETPNATIEEVWSVVTTGQTPNANYGEPKDIYRQLEELTTYHQTRMDTIKRQAKERDTKQKGIIGKLSQELEALRNTQSCDRRWQFADSTSLASVAAASTDFATTAAPFEFSPPEPQSSFAKNMKARQARYEADKVPTTEPAQWRLSIEQARYLMNKNKTINDLWKADIAAEIAKQTTSLGILALQKDKEITSLKQQASMNSTKIRKLSSMDKDSESTMASLAECVSKTPNRPVIEAWKAAVGEGRVQLLHRTKPRSESICFAADMITVNVGDVPTVFHVPRSLLCDASEFFKTATKVEWREGQTKLVNLPDDTCASFSNWLNWLYRRELTMGPNEGEAMDQASYHQNWRSLMAAYSLGRKLLDGDYKDAVVDAMAVLALTRHGDRCRYAPPRFARTQIFGTTNAGSTARRLIVNIMAHAKSVLTDNDDPNLLLDVLKLDVGPKPSYKGFLIAAATCEFHEHAEGDMHCYRHKYKSESTFMG